MINIQGKENILLIESRKNQIKPIHLIVIIATIFFAICSLLRHEAFYSGYDLAIFDQAVYLISEGKTPISSLMGFHILGDHAAFILYPISLFYMLYRSVYWLFFLQALALSLSAYFLWAIGIRKGLSEKQALAISIAYFMYPATILSNWFEFHPDTLAVPAILGSVLSLQSNRKFWFLISIFFAISCKESIALVVSFMGLWILFFEKKKWFGYIAIFVGISWFIYSSNVVIPFYTSLREPQVLSISDVPAGFQYSLNFRYGHLGSSSGEILKNLFVNPDLIISQVFSIQTLKYTLLLIFPVIWGISFSETNLSPIISSIPVFLANILSRYDGMRSLKYHYDILIVPFLFISIILTIASGKGFFSRFKYIVIWSILILILGVGARLTIMRARNDSLFRNYVSSVKEAIEIVQTKGSVLTTSEISPHLTHRPVVKIHPVKNFSHLSNDFDYILLNLNSKSIPKLDMEKLFFYLDSDKINYNLSYSKNSVFLFINRH